MRKATQLISLVALIFVLSLPDAKAQQNAGTGSAWGSNTSGQFGNGTATSSPTPGPAATNLSGLIAVSGGNSHSLWLKSDGTVWAAGSNGYGLFIACGTGNGSVTPIQVPGLSGVVAISAGYYHSMALKNDGSVWVWGRAFEGQLGNGVFTDTCTPTQVSSLSGIVAISAGNSHNMALKSDGTVWAWGWGAYGQLGNGTFVSSGVPVQVSNLSGVVAIAANYVNSYAVKSDGTAWAWGQGFYGALGNGTTTDSSTPVQVINLSSVTRIAISVYSFAALAVKSDGTVWAWGNNELGQLGNGTTTFDRQNSTPVQVSGLSGVTAVAGDGFGMALKSDGTVWAWGFNAYGQLGNGTTASSTTPVQVSNLSSTAAIGAGRSFGLAVARTAPSYRIIPLPSGLRANDVNDTGQAAGCYPGASPSILHAVIYSNGNITDLGVGDNSCANVINNKGDVAGINGAGHVFFWSAAATPQLQDLGLPPHTYIPYGIQNIGGINDADQIGGSAYIGSYTEGFIWQPGQMGQPGTWNELQTDPVNGVLSIGLNAINDLGDVAGQTTLYSRYSGAFTLGYLRTNSGTASVISPNPYWQHCGYNGAQVPTVIAAGISNSGEVVGSHGGNLCNVPVAFIYTTSGGLALHDGSSQTLEDDALGVTNDGRVLVTFLIYDNNLVYPANRYSILYSAPGFSGGYSLTQMVRPDCGWTYLYGSRISRNTGSIIGAGLNPSNPTNLAFLMTPLSSPAQTMADGCTVPPANPTPTSLPHVSQPIVEAAGPNGASVTLDGSGSTAPNGGALTYLWTGPFGTASGVNPTVTLPVGTSTITLTVTDNLGHSGSATIQITVQDTTPPVLTLPASVSLQATSTSGAVVNYTASANDLVSGAVAANCTPASGSTFPIGTTTVNCSATDAAGNTATGTFTVTVTQLSQTITFGQLPSPTYGDPDFLISATASSALPLTLTTGSNPYCSIIGFTVHIITAGICPITAQQAGNGTYLPVTVTQSITIAQAKQTITFGPLASHTYGDPDFSLSATSSSGLPVTLTAYSNPYCMLISPNFTVHIITAGICPITAQQAGDGNYLPAPPVTQSFTILQATQTITFAPLPNHTYGDPDFPLSATSSSGLPVTLTAYSNPYCMLISPNFTVHIITAGICPITAQQAGNGNYLPAPNVTQSFTIAKANQTITLTGVPSSALFGQGPFALSATATSGLAVALSATGNCLLSVSSLSLTGAGSCAVTTSQAGNGNYNAAPTLNPSFSIGQAPTATNASVSPGTVKYSDYTTLTATVSPISAGGQSLTGNVQFYLNGNAVGSPVAMNGSGVATLSQVQVNLSAGSYPVKAVFSSTNANFAGNTGTTTQIVTQENAFILYSGDTIAQVGTPMNLRATVWDSAASGYPGVNPESGPGATIGDITKIWIAFDIYPAGSCGSGTTSTMYAQVALTGTPGIGTATTILSSPSEVSYCVVSRLVAGSAGGTNQFYTAPNAETVGLNFYVNSGQFVTGGGWVNDPSGTHGNFGFNARYNSSGSPKGQMVYVYRALYNGVPADFIIKSNALTALQFTGTTYPISATLQGKANVQINRASDGVALFSAGNYTFSTTVTDSGQNGNAGKQFSLTTYDSSGVPYHIVASGTPLQGGNIVIHSQ